MLDKNLNIWFAGKKITAEQLESARQEYYRNPIKGLDTGELRSTVTKIISMLPLEFKSIDGEEIRIRVMVKPYAYRVGGVHQGYMYGIRLICETDNVHSVKFQNTLKGPAVYNQIHSVGSTLFDFAGIAHIEVFHFRSAALLVGDIDPPADYQEDYLVEDWI